MPGIISPFVCGDCSKKAAVLMKIGADRDDWVYMTCDRCLDYTCAAHGMESEDGRVLCEGCTMSVALGLPPTDRVAR